MEGPGADDPYRWVIEFQCVEKWGMTVFFGINFYARSPDPSQIPEVRPPPASCRSCDGVLDQPPYGTVHNKNGSSAECDRTAHAVLHCLPFLLTVHSPLCGALCVDGACRPCPRPRPLHGHRSTHAHGRPQQLRILRRRHDAHRRAAQLECARRRDPAPLLREGTTNG